MVTFRFRSLPSKFTLSHLSWSAIIAGTLVGLMIQVTLLLLGTAVGLYAVDTEGGLAQFGGLGVGASLWWMISAIVSLFIGGWLTSRFAGLQKIFDGILHGVVTWSAIMVLTVVTLGNVAGGFASGAVGSIGGAFSSLGRTPEAALGVGENFTNALGAAALWAFFALLLSAAAAGFGGYLGRVRSGK